MSAFYGFAQAALQMGLTSVLVKPKRGLYSPTLANGKHLPDIIAQVVLEEHHHDELEITDHPIEQGAAITDHAFKRPAEVTLHLGWSNSPSSNGSLANAALGFAAAQSGAVRQVSNVLGVVKAATSIQSLLSGNEVDQSIYIYKQLLELQSSRATFDLYTGKRVYTDMLCKSLTTETDAKSANSMVVTMVCRQILRVNTQTVTLPKHTQQEPLMTSTPVNKGGLSLRPAK